MTYKVYRITSPSKKCYIGITSQPIAKRWAGHVRRALKENINHPFSNAIRKYGKESFTFKILETVETADEAKEAEIYYIFEFDSTNRDKGYNVSKGGDYDGQSGGKKFWEEIRKNPDIYELYIENLKEGIRLSIPNRDYSKVKEQKAKWREENPELFEEQIIKLRSGLLEWQSKNPEVYARQKREAGISLSKYFVKHLAEIQPKVTAGVKKYFENPQAIEAHSKRVAATWASYSEEDRQGRIAAAAQGHKEHYAKMDSETKEERDKQLADARKNIDHEKRKRNQKIAMQNYWTPERKKEFGEKRSLLNAKKRALKAQKEANES
ncbi:MAG: GIY-YIG nuclease family protein [Rhodospirillales bacterium]|nr:GIY-YIG nuclease family protein [Rhodospirillales bacterium]